MQHRRVALEKLLSRNQEVFKFEIVVDEPETLMVDKQHRFRGLGIDIPKMNAPRFPAALNILTDLNLITPNLGGYHLTNHGTSLLERFSRYKIPQWKEVENDQVIEFSQETAG